MLLNILSSAKRKKVKLFYVNLRFNLIENPTEKGVVKSERDGRRRKKGGGDKTRSNFYKIREPGRMGATDPPTHDLIMK